MSFVSRIPASYFALLTSTIDIMRRFLALATAISLLALGTSAKQVPLGQPMKDPSFPQAGVMDSPGTNTAVGDTAHGANLADTLTLERKAGLWWEYARDVSSVCYLIKAIQAKNARLHQ
jgi:hypothetical protein